MKKSLISKLSVLAIAGVVALTGCSKPVEIKYSFEKGEIYTSKAVSKISMESTGAQPMNMDMDYDFAMSTTVDNIDKDGNTDISIKYDDISMKFNAKDPAQKAMFDGMSEQVNTQMKSLIDTVKLTAKVSKDGKVSDFKGLEAFGPSASSMTSSFNSMSGVGKTGTIKEGDTWKLSQSIDTPEGPLNVDFDMKCDKIDDQKIYVSGTGKMSTDKDKANSMKADITFKSELAKDNAFVAKTTMDMKMSIAPTPEEKVNMNMNMTIETTKKK